MTCRKHKANYPHAYGVHCSEVLDELTHSSPVDLGHAIYMLLFTIIMVRRGMSSNTKWQINQMAAR